MSVFFFFNDTATTEIYTLSLHDALPISFKVTEKVLRGIESGETDVFVINFASPDMVGHTGKLDKRSEEHTSELQSRPHLVCRLLLEKKKKTQCTSTYHLPERLTLERSTT